MTAHRRDEKRLRAKVLYVLDHGLGDGVYIGDASASGRYGNALTGLDGAPEFQARQLALDFSSNVDDARPFPLLSQTENSWID
jgi:hypothetical protein